MSENITLWKNEFRQINLIFEGREAIVVLPRDENRSGKWLLKTEYFGAFQEMELEFVRRGYALAFVANRDRWAADIDLEVKSRFCEYVARTYHLEEKCVPVGMSCGGMIAIKFAARYPHLVRALYLDAPVVNLLSCPCGFGMGTILTQEDVRKALHELGMQSISDLLSYRDHPLDNLPRLIEKRIPAALVCGDADTAVAYPENGLLVKQAYEASNVPFKFILKAGGEHHPHGPRPEEMEDMFRFLDGQ